MKSERGFTLIELMVSISIFAIVSAMMATSFAQLLHQVHDNEIRSGAFNVAQEVLDQLRSTDPATMPTSGSTAAQTIADGGRNYSAVTSYCTTAGLCPTNTIRQVRVIVSYNGTLRYQVDTIFSQLQ